MAVRPDGEAFKVFRLGIGRQVFKLTQHQYQALMLFDGWTTYQEAAARYSVDVVEFVQQIVDLGDLAAEPMLDPAVLARLLSANATRTPG